MGPLRPSESILRREQKSLLLYVEKQKQKQKMKNVNWVTYNNYLIYFSACHQVHRQGK